MVEKKEIFLGERKMNHRGTITIPAEVRDFLGLINGDEIGFFYDKDEKRTYLQRKKVKYEDLTEKQEPRKDR